MREEEEEESGSEGRGLGNGKGRTFLGTMNERKKEEMEGGQGF